MVDRVQVLKRESGDLGGDPFDEQPWPEPIEPQEDAIEVAGVYFQDSSNRDENVLISRDGDDITFKDGSNPTPVTLSEIAAGVPSVAARVGDVLHSIDGSTFTVQQPLTSENASWLIQDEGVLLVVG
jgi:hypothetical protein